MTTHETAPQTTPNHPTPDAPILLIGGHGKTGRRVAKRLERLGRTTRVASRTTPIPFDWDRPETWPAALEGVRTAYVTYQPDLSIPAAAFAIEAFADTAVETGMERLVLLSGRGEDGARRCEDIVLARLPRSTVLTCAWFAQNFSEGMLRNVVLSGTIALPVPPDMSEPFLDADDIADAAVAALLDEAYAGLRFELTGPESLTFGEIAETLTAASGRSVQFFPVTRADFVAGAVAGGVPVDEAEMLASLFADVLDGRNVATADGVQQILGRPATPFEVFAHSAAAGGAWGQVEDTERAS